MAIDIPTLIRRADKYAARTGRTAGGVSKLIFDDVRTLDLLRQGGENVTVARLRRALERLNELDAERTA